MDDADMAVAFLACIEYMATGSNQSADLLAEALGEQHPGINVDELKRGLRAHASEIQLMHGLDRLRAFKMLGELIGGHAPGWGQ